MFDWFRYVILAKLLINNNDEESIRTAISRLYYGFFGVIRRYLINVKNKYYLNKCGGNVHFFVYRELFNSNDATEVNLANILNKLRTIRNNADYDGDYDKEFFESFFEDCEKEIIIGLDSLEYLKKHHYY